MTHPQQEIGRRIWAVVLIGLGVLFLLEQTLEFDIFSFGWPFFIILPGLVLLYFASRGDAYASPLAVPGAIVTGTGVILFYQNITGRWESWAYAWALYPVFLGLALTFIGERINNQEAAKVGRGFVRWGGMAFVALWALFELVIFGDNQLFGSLLVPVLFIGAGVWLLFRGTSTEKPKRSQAIFSGPSAIVPKSKNDYSLAASEKLRQEMGAALAEDNDISPTS